MRLVEGPPSELEGALAAAVKEAQADDPLAPVGVLLGGTLLRPYLQRRLAELNEGIVNVRFMMPSELAMELGERSLVVEGQRPLPPLADRILLREIAASRDGYFEPVRDTPGLADAFHRLVRELRGAGYDASSLEKALDGSCEVPEKASAIGEIFGEFLERRFGFYGPDDCLLAAEPNDAPWEALFVYGLWQAPAKLSDTLIALGERLLVTVYLPTTGIEDVDSAHAELRGVLAEAGADEAALTESDASATALGTARRRLFTIPDDPSPEDDSLKLVSAPDPAREVHEVARHCLAWARDGIGFHEMAIAYRHPEPYRSIIESVFQEADIPVYLHEGTPMSERPLGRRVIALLELLDSHFERRAVTDFLADGKLPEKTWEKYERPTPSTWDRFSRKAGVVRGFEQWEQRLETYAAELEGSDREWEQEDVLRVRALLRFIRDLHSDLSGQPEEASWSEHLAAIQKLLRTYVDDPSPILDAVAGLGRFDALDATTTAERFRQAVIAAIENLRTEEVERGSAGAFGLRGVNVLDVNSLRHLRFRAVAVIGLAERSFPSPPSPDPILLDHEREALNANGSAPIPLRVRGADPEPLQFALAAHAATDRLLATYPRKGSADGRPELPSRFFRVLAEAAMGERVAAQDVDALPDWLYHRASGSRIGARSLDRALSLGEYDRTLLETEPDLARAMISRAEPRFARALEARKARRSAELTEFDGVLTPDARRLLHEVFDPAGGASPSLLEDYATCPQRTFIASVIRARQDDEPETIIKLSDADRGSLLHSVYERFLARAPKDGEKRIHGPSEEQRLIETAEEVFAEYEARGATGYPAIWAADRLELIEDLKAWLEAERSDERAHSLPNGAYEVRFGYGRGYDSESDGGLSSDEPLEIKAGKVTLKVSGRVDRLNWDPTNEQFRVVDYKTGSTYDKPKDGRLGGGRSVQLPLYLLAAAQLLGMEPSQGEAEYHYSTRKGGFKRGRFTSEHYTDRRADLERLLGDVLEAMREGVFHMAIRSKDDCGYCVANALCPVTRLRLVEQKRDSKPNRAIERIREIE